jgi:EmrB/QacA subfamily drug resistance transporter
MDDSSVKWSALVAATLAAFLPPFMGASINIALPSIGDEFTLDAVSLSWIATSYLLAAAMFLVPLGRIADIYGRKKVFTYGTLIYTLSSFLSAISSSAVTLIAFRVLQGIGSAMLFGTGVAILTAVFPAGERGKVLGWNTAGVYTGLSVGPVLGGFLTQQWGWRSIFLANVPLGLIIIVFVLWKLKGEWAAADGERFDLAGSIVFSLSLVALMAGFSWLPDVRAVWLILAGLGGIGAFVVWETKAESPVLNINLFRQSPTFAFSNLAALINYSATAAVGFLLSLYLQYIKGMDAETAGFVLVSQPIVMAVFSPLTGWLSDRIEPRIVASVGMALTVIGLALFTLLDGQTTLIFIEASLIFIGLGFALFSSPNTNAVMSSVEKRYLGIAAATLGTMRLTGQMLSLGTAALVFALIMGRVQITPEYYPLFLSAMQIAFLIFAALCVGGVVASLVRGKVRPVGPIGQSHSFPEERNPL